MNSGRRHSRLSASHLLGGQGVTSSPMGCFIKYVLDCFYCLIVLFSCYVFLFRRWDVSSRLRKGDDVWSDGLHCANAMPSVLRGLARDVCLMMDDRGYSKNSFMS